MKKQTERALEQQADDYRGKFEELEKIANDMKKALHKKEA